MIDYIGVSDILRLVTRVGPGPCVERMRTSDGRLYSFKYVNGHPKNTAAGLLTVTAFGVLADVQTGYPLLLSELTFTTALRTAAMSALAARRMARPASRVLPCCACASCVCMTRTPRLP